MTYIVVVHKNANQFDNVLIPVVKLCKLNKFVKIDGAVLTKNILFYTKNTQIMSLRSLSNCSAKNYFWSSFSGSNFTASITITHYVRVAI